MKRLSLLFYRGSGMGGALVRWWTKSPYGHAAVGILDPDGTPWIYEAVCSGVARRRPFVSSADMPAAFVEVPVSDGAAKAAWNFACSCLGDRYDWLALSFDVLGRYLPDGTEVMDNLPGKWDCSRFAAAVLRAAGVLPDSLSDLRCPVAPGDIYKALTEKDGKL